MPNNPTASSSRAREYQEANGDAPRAAGMQQDGGEHEHGSGRDKHAVAHRRATLARDEEDRQPVRQRRPRDQPQCAQGQREPAPNHRGFARSDRCGRSERMAPARWHRPASKMPVLKMVTLIFASPW